MYTKWYFAILLSIVLAVVSSQNTTTTASPTTTAAPQTTSQIPTTTSTTIKPSTTIKTSTIEPSTTTTVAPPPPTPPKPESWNGTVSDQNTTCINVKFTVQIDVSYNNTNGTQLLTGFTVPSDAVVDPVNSYCSSNETEPQAIAISFKNEEHTSANLTLVFNNTDKEVRVQKVELSFNLTQELFPGFHDPTLYGTIVTISRNDLSLFKVGLAHSYVCSASQTADLGGQNGINDVKIDFLDSQVEAYIHEGKPGQFDSAIDCKSTEISDVVPIAVGAALAGLVVIVLIAYFIGRRRSRRLAYQSV